ncbi:MAG: PDZ domain-containing protein, partial [Oligoflexus sp.]
MQRPYWIMNWAILVCGLAAWVYLQRSESAGARVQAGFSLASLPGVPEASSRAKDERRGAWVNSGLSESLLIDSILTIVQNYYVDESRVDNRELMASTLKSLEEQDLVKLSFRSASEWIVSNGSDRFEVSFSSRYTYDEMMRDSLRLAQFLDKHRKDRLPGGRPVPSGAFLLLNAMLAGLDPHSNLLNPEEYRDLRQGTEGSFGGLGVVVGMQDDVLTVIKPLPKSPAARAGVSKSDRIMQIDSKSTFGTTLDDLVQYMRGEPGTRVN